MDKRWGCQSNARVKQLVTDCSAVHSRATLSSDVTALALEWMLKLLVMLVMLLVLMLQVLMPLMLLMLGHEEERRLRRGKGVEIDSPASATS